MKRLTRGQWRGLLGLAVIALISGGAAVYGVQGAFASLGMMVLMGMTGAGGYVLAKAFRHSETLVRAGCLERTKSAVAFEGGLKYASCSRSATAKPGILENGRLIMQHAEEFPENGGERNREESAEAMPISQEDKRLIMEHIDELFEPEGDLADSETITEEDERLIMEYVYEFLEIDEEQGRQWPAEAEPITEEDKKVIMGHIDELFVRGRWQSEDRTP